MTYNEFLKELSKAGLSVRAFAELVDMNRNSVSNYAKSDEVPRHLAVISALLGEMHVQGLDFAGVVARVSKTPKKPRGGAKPGRFGGDKQEELEWDS